MAGGEKPGNNGIGGKQDGFLEVVYAPNYKPPISVGQRVKEMNIGHSVVPVDYSTQKEREKCH